MPSPRKKKKPFDPFDEDTYPGEEEQQEKGLPAPVWPDALEAILNRYQPGTEHQYDERLATQEIQTMLSNHCGQAPQKPELVEELTQRGYKYAMLGNGLEWLFTKKK